MVIRTLAGITAIGAGVVHLALVPGTVLPLLLVLAVIGAAQVAWGVVALVRRAVPVPSLALLGGIAPAFLFPLAAVGGDALLSALPTAALLGATVLSLGGAFLVALHQRAERRQAEPRRARPALVLPALAIGVGVIAGIATPAIAASEIGGATTEVVDEQPEQAPQPELDAPEEPTEAPDFFPGHTDH
ncbi:hypothetical protein OVN20_01365 [Microcella daejeonensis]|uniref:hypothetical protein n=1 Tax=Microcella daejeonensis TaxID=2994971 RepID=UPI00227041B7|nr:hypothetical protein [Microcella daejeonensis]WAB84252.1 hypothetical protein OVN20_01365 [Microcella daejeonensis]